MSEDGRRCAEPTDRHRGDRAHCSGLAILPWMTPGTVKKEAKAGYLCFNVDDGDSAVMVAERDGLSSGSG